MNIFNEEREVRKVRWRRGAINQNHSRGEGKGQEREEEKAVVMHALR